jgi:hypothetical protein
MIEHLIQSNSTPTKPTPTKPTPTNHTNKPNHQMKKIKIPFQLLNQVSQTDILLSGLLKDDTSLLHAYNHSINTLHMQHCICQHYTNNYVPFI